MSHSVLDFLKLVNDILDKSLSATFYYGIFIDVNTIRFPSLHDKKSYPEYMNENNIGHYYLPGKFASDFLTKSKLKNIFSIFFGISSKSPPNLHIKFEKEYKKTVQNILKLCTILTYFMYLCPSSNYGILVDHILNYIFIDSSRAVLSKFIQKNNWDKGNFIAQYTKFCRLVFFFVHLYFIFMGKNIFTENQINNMNDKIFIFINTLNDFVYTIFGKIFYNTQLSLQKESLFVASTILIDKSIKIATTKLSIYLAQETRKYDNKNSGNNNKKIVNIHPNQDLIINLPSNSFLNFITKSTYSCVNNFIIFINYIFSSGESIEYISNIDDIINNNQFNNDNNPNNSFFSAMSNLDDSFHSISNNNFNYTS
jgi:hypothetical protein